MNGEFSRDEIFARLDAARRAPLVLVVGPARSGKTTVVSRYLADRSIDHLRLHVAPDFAEPVAFVDALTATLAPAVPGMRMSSILAVRRTNSDADVATLASWAAHHLRGADLTLVLDDADHLAADPVCVRLLDQLIRATVPNVRWIVSLRETTKFPVGRWLTEALCELQVDLPRNAAANGAATGDACVYADLFAGAAARCSAADLRVLLTAALLRRSSLRTLPAGDTPTSLLLQSWTADGIAVPGPDETFTFDERVRTHALTRVDSLAPEDRSELLHATADVLESAGRWSEALAVRVRAGDPERLVAAVARRGFDAIENGDAPAVRRAFDALPEDVIVKQPTALAVRAALASADERFDISEAWFRMAILGAQGTERDAIVLRFGLDLVRWGRDDAAAFVENEIQRAPRHGSSAAMLLGVLATAYVLTQRMSDARTAMRRALASVETVDAAGARARIFHQAAYVALNDNDLAAAGSLAQRALELAMSVYYFDLAARALSVLHNIAVVSDDPRSARQHLGDMEACAHKAGSTSLLMYALLNRFELEVESGNTSALADIEEQLRRLHVLLTRMASESLLPAQAMRAAWNGKFAHAANLLRSSAEKQVGEERQAYRFAETALYAAAAGNRIDAAEAIRKSRAMLRTLETREPWPLHAHAFLVIAEVLLGHKRRASRSLDALDAMSRYAGPRVRALVEAVAALRERWAGGFESDGRLCDALDRLEAVEFGGVARFIEALRPPMRHTAQEGAA